jgi:trehalose 6-phosphate phosphatase
MIYFLNELESLRKRWEGQKAMLFLDFDGTLTPIVETPDMARLSKPARNALEAISKWPQFQLIIISGRSLEDIQDRVGVKDAIYAGNHGFEIKGPGMEFRGLSSPAYRKQLGDLKREMNEKLDEFPGAFIEDKGETLSVHYRQVKEEQRGGVEQLIERIAESYFSKKEIRYSTGKKVFEIRPPLDWGKGKAVMWILERKKGFPIYIGDDSTDEDAFLALGGMGITVHVGNQDTSRAQYYLNDTDEVVKFLELLPGANNHDQITKP